MKLSHFLPITAVVAGCSSLPPVLPSAPVTVVKPTPTVTKPMRDCIAGVEIILEYPYGDGLTLQMMRPDSCADRLGDFLYRQKIERRGQIVFAVEKLPPGILKRTLDVLATRGQSGEQEIYVAGKLQKGSTGRNLLIRIEDMEKNGITEKN